MEVICCVKKGRKREGTSVLCMISGFWRKVAEKCSPLGFYAASSGNYYNSVRNNPVERNSQGKQKVMNTNANLSGP